MLTFVRKNFKNVLEKTLNISISDEQIETIIHDIDLNDLLLEETIRYTTMDEDGEVNIGNTNDLTEEVVEYIEYTVINNRADDGVIDAVIEDAISDDLKFSHYEWQEDYMDYSDDEEDDDIES